MKELIEKAKAALQDKLEYVRERDIIETPSINFVPPGVKPPCVCIKDGPIKTEELAGGMMRWTMQIKLVVYVLILKKGASLMGDAGTGKKGVLEMAADVHAILDENLLGISGMTKAATVKNEPESEYFGDEKDGVQRKVLTYEYEKEGPRPSEE